MTRLSDVVRGVEEKKVLTLDEKFLNANEYARHKERVKGHNSLASAEVVVSTESVIKAMESILAYNDFAGIFHFGDESSSHLEYKELVVLAKAIATAIESGAVIRLKEKE